ncbi:Ovarian carcinoma immunoreactive antigen [Trinorchestia longiramus]|nr:Ovarian carcinoma immunoreactive antigen [Trinorchestia longiramus]
MDKSGDQQNYYPSPVANSDGLQGPGGPPSQPGGPNQQRNLPTTYKFSAEEMRVLKECGRESLLFRSIPFATVTSCLTYYGLAKGYLKTNPTFGFFPKVTFAAIVGYFVGKLSYQKQCADMVLQLPNSKLADAIRKSRGLGPTSEVDPDAAGGSNTHEVFTSIPSKPIFDDHKPDERDRNEALDDYQRVTDSLAEYTLPSPSSAETSISYEERRRNNREEYASKMLQRSSKIPAPGT